MKILPIVLLSLLCSFAFAYDVSLTASQNQFSSDAKITVNIETNIDFNEDTVWDTYLIFQDSRKTPVYISVDGNSLNPTPLGMLPPSFTLQPKNWSNNETVHLQLILCHYQTKEAFAQAELTLNISGNGEVHSQTIPVSPQLDLVQEVATESTDRYTDYKQFDSRWKSVKMGQYGGTSIGKSGCAMSAAGNIIGWTPKSLNSRLQSNGGYSGNLLIWTKVPGLSYKGNGQLDSSLFSRYHVIASLGGHFVLLTGSNGKGSYYSKDPGKSSNPIYTPSQVRSVRLYYK